MIKKVLSLQKYPFAGGINCHLPITERSPINGCFKCACSKQMLPEVAQKCAELA